jgi:phage virion morphogenesis protein
MAEGITVKIEGQELGRKFTQLQSLISDLTPAMDEVGGALLARIQQCFVDQASPEGLAWKPLSSVTIAQRERLGYGEGQILRRTGELFRSITYQAGPDSVEIGSSSPYASTHQMGAAQGQFGRTKRGGPIPWGNIPARHFLFEGSPEAPELPDTWIAAVTAILSDWLDRAEGR